MLPSKKTLTLTGLAFAAGYSFGRKHPNKTLLDHVSEGLNSLSDKLDEMAQSIEDGKAEPKVHEDIVVEADIQAEAARQSSGTQPSATGGFTVTSSTDGEPPTQPGSDAT